MSDSDIRVTPDFLRTIADEFADPKLGVSSCPYRAVPGKSFWSTLEAIGMNTEFLAGVIVARMLEGMKFALGPTATARKQVLADIGGWERLKDYLAEDFVLGNFGRREGLGCHSVVVCCRASHRLTAIGFERATSIAVVSEYPPLPTGRICRSVIHEPFASGADPLSDPAGLVACRCRYRAGPSTGGRGYCRLDSSRSLDDAPLVSCSRCRIC